MSFLQSFFDNNQTVQATFQEKATTVTGTVIDESWQNIQQGGSDLVLTALLYQKSSAEQVLKDKITVRMDLAILIDPEDVTVTIPDNGRVIVDGVTYYIIAVDNIAFQNKVILIPLSREPIK